MPLNPNFITKFALSALLITACTRQQENQAHLQQANDAPEQCTDTVELSVAKDQKS